ncbi:unnamed protein product [Amoebophrya sp. A120]|nr:unnamed protein product [Amoebophrya sp. A120]|eukprot:GSA120T00019881001.1
MSQRLAPLVPPCFPFSLRPGLGPSAGLCLPTLPRQVRERFPRPWGWGPPSRTSRAPLVWGGAGPLLVRGRWAPARFILDGSLAPRVFFPAGGMCRARPRSQRRHASVAPARRPIGALAIFLPGGRCVIDWCAIARSLLACWRGGGSIDRRPHARTFLHCVSRGLMCAPSDGMAQVRVQSVVRTVPTFPRKINACRSGGLPAAPPGGLRGSLPIAMDLS